MINEIGHDRRGTGVAEERVALNPRSRVEPEKAISIKSADFSLTNIVCCIIDLSVNDTLVQGSEIVGLKRIREE